MGVVWTLHTPQNLRVSKFCQGNDLLLSGYPTSQPIHWGTLICRLSWNSCRVRTLPPWSSGSGESPDSSASSTYTCKMFEVNVQCTKVVTSVWRFLLPRLILVGEPRIMRSSLQLHFARHDSSRHRIRSRLTEKRKKIMWLLGNPWNSGLACLI